MGSSSSFPFFSWLADRVEGLLVGVVERITSVRSGILWTVSYIILLALMYLFHAPFRSLVNTHTDWYAKLTKGLQIWLGVAFLCFHVGPHLYRLKANDATGLKGGKGEHGVLVEDTAVTIFYPMFCFNSFLFLILHKLKRRYKLAFTYGPSLTLILINSVLLSMFATMHYSVCDELYRAVASARASGNMLKKLCAITVCRTPLIVCPRRVVEAPFRCLLFLSIVCIVFVLLDYLYKVYRGNGDPSRGILWAELYPTKPQSDAFAAHEAVDSSESTQKLLHWWRKLASREKDSEPSEQLHVHESEPRRAKSLFKALLSSRQRSKGAPGVAGPEGWKDRYDQMSLAAAKFVSQPTNRPGMVPWFSTFIFNTIWQAVARLALGFLTFDVRFLQQYAAPKVFDLHFEKSLENFPRLSLVQARQDDNSGERKQKSEKAEEPMRPRSDASGLKNLVDASYEAAKTSLQELSTSASKTPVNGRNGTPPLPASHTPTTATAAAAASEPEGESDGKPDVWFDWIADLGDGFNPTYALARLLAQPFLKLSLHHPSKDAAGLAKLKHQSDAALPESVPPGETPQYLPRGSFVVMGGDLAYPTPSDDTFMTRLFGPYRDALSGNTHVKQIYHTAKSQIVMPDAEDTEVTHLHQLDAMTISKMASQHRELLHDKVSVEEALRSVPLLFAIPGNHDWFDGLLTYTKYILENAWLGGWLMPQRSSYFVLRLPYNWFMLCLDGGYEKDIDAVQRNYFLSVVEKYMNEQSCVILASHVPGWLYEWVDKFEEPSQPEIMKVCKALGQRLRVRVAGDIHNYSRHVPRDEAAEAPMLVVSGGGGAFMHGHRPVPVEAHDVPYRRICAFPLKNTHKSLLSRLLGFRVINWKFDLIIGVCCFMVVFSLLPQSIKDAHRGPQRAVLATLPDAVAVWWERLCMYIALLFTRGVASLVTTIFFFAVYASAGSDEKAALWKRCLYASFWTTATVLICFSMLSFLLCTLEYMVDHKLVVSTKDHWGSALEDQVRLTVDALVNHMQAILGGAERSFLARLIHRMQVALYGNPLVRLIGFLLRCLDPLEMFVYLSEKVSSDEIGTFAAGVNRIDKVLYYLYFLFYYWLLVTPLVSFVIGSYLLCSVTFLNWMYDATYSAFQVEEFKNFVRFKIDAKTRELHAYVVAMRYVPKTWHWDEAHQEELNSDAAESAPAHLRAHPSRWNGKPSAAGAKQSGKVKDGSATEGNEDGAVILEHFVCPPHSISGAAS
ncbi:hypothetical protein ABL78_5998 [Leptomonas seymouri]|uniref:Calcineurin-like phosphoesterase domain-containing protein n=1 Tax=Leptomonas seymouri TaxID=5684 RepID=A0A0N1IJB3_LEPSE|nr:hypothetical protein ABL78_5998 [Leptomonas seymouri]|eukprot:KPI84955.1 hypothetical protein ABL78_5998 [Leptomonas seymouri]